MGRKRQIIIDAAEGIISRKGFLKSNISEIAGKAGVNDSVIYHYFSSKEDLLFSVMEENVSKILDKLNDQLQGILDPLSKLGKMIWFHLNYNDTHLDYARLLLFECRSNKNFYQHSAYRKVRKYAGILLAILQDGVEKKVFRNDVDMNLVRDMIFGLLDWEILQRIASDEITDTTSDFEDIMVLILPMVVAEASDTISSDKSDIILEAAEAVFAEKGYTQSTITEIARRAKVGEGTIYEYFKNKEHLLFAIPVKRFNEQLNSLDEIFEIKSLIRKLRRIIRYYFYYHLNERNFLKIFILHITLNKEFYGSDAYKGFEKCSENFDGVIEEGKKTGIFRPEINLRIFKNLFFGLFSHLALRWLILEESVETDKIREIEDVISLLTTAVTTPKALQEYRPFLPSGSG